LGATTNAFQILNVVTTARSGLTFSAVVEKTGLPRASTHRLLKELVALDALSFQADTRTYEGGILLAHLGAEVTASFDLRKMARASLTRLSEQTGYVATLGVSSGDHGTYLDKIEPSSFGLKLHSEIGRAFPLHATGLGKVLLANSPPAILEAVLFGTLKSYSANTITQPADLVAEMDRVRSDGFAIDDEEITAGLTCIAAPINDLSGDVVGALSCTFPTSLENNSGVRRLTETVMQAAANVFHPKA
jgi:DNA-binding IclR family transcriptional regulator